MENLKRILNNQEPILPNDSIDGNIEKAVFLEEGTDEDWEEYDHKENKGWGKFISKVFNLNSEKSSE